MKKRLCYTGLLLIILLSNTTYSQWSTDPTVNNAICTQTNNQVQPTITSDGSGGYIITWSDNRNSNIEFLVLPRKVARQLLGSSELTLNNNFRGHSL